MTREYQKTKEIPQEIWKWLHDNQLNFIITLHGFAYKDETNKHLQWTVKANLTYLGRPSILVRVKKKENPFDKGWLEAGYSGWGRTPDEALIQLFFFLQNKYLVFNNYKVDDPDLKVREELLVPDFNIKDEEHEEKFKRN